VEFDWFIVIFVTVISIGAKFAGAWLGALGTEISKEDRLSIGIAFTPSGVTGIVVADLALEYGILTTPVFVGIVVSAIVSSLMVGPWLSWSIRRRKALNVLDLFARSATVPSLQGATQWEVLDEMCKGLRGSVPASIGDALLEEVRAREDLCGTGCGHGLAIPHARLSGLDRPVIALGRSAGGVEWNAPDGLPVHLVFLILTPEDEHGLQLQILAAIAQGLADEEARERVLHAESDREMWGALGEAIRSQTITRVAAA
jgi:mannitol/fructose-specific phosphotransferase system IIA component (Ntr-type)